MRGNKAAAMALVLALAACSERPGPALLKPSGAELVAGAQEVTVYTVTTRPDTGQARSADALAKGGQVRYLAYDISIPPAHESGRIEYPSRHRKADPTQHFMTLQRHELSEAQLVAATRNDTAGVYVHGFNTSLQEAVYRAAQLGADRHINGSPILFSWPSYGHVTAYLADRDAADSSRTALAGLLTELTEARRSAKPLPVLAHSMGARLLMETLRQLKLSGRQDVLNRIEVVLAAPDIDIDVFLEQVHLLGKMRLPITVLVSSDDAALQVSSRIAGGRERVGMIDVRDPQVQALALARGIRIIDITALKSDDPAHSRYVGFLTTPGAGVNSELFSGLRQVGGFVFGQVGGALQDIGTAFDQ